MSGPSVRTLAGVLVGLFLASGRWSLARLFGEDSSMTFEPRLWLVAALLALAFAPHGHPLSRLSIGARGMLTAWLSFLGYHVVSSAWAPDLAFAGAKALELALVAGVLGSIARLRGLVDGAELSQMLWRTLGAVYGLFAALALLGTTGDGRLSVLGGGPNVFGRNMAMLSLLCIDAVIARRRTALAGGGVAVGGMLVLLSGSRGAILAVVVGVAVLLWARRIKLGRLAQAGLVLAVAAVLAAMFTDAGQAAVHMFRERVIRLTLEQEHDSGRSWIYKQAIELGLSSPVCGDGLAGFPARGFFVYPHNMFLEAFAEGGLVGVALLTWAVVLGLRLVVRRPVEVRALDLAAFAASLSCAQFSGDFFDARGAMIFALVAALQTTGVARPLAGHPGGPQPRAAAHA